MFDHLASSLLNEGTGLIAVHSCFSGLAIYDPRAIEFCDYDDKTQDCEHVPFHRCMREVGLDQLYVDPLLSTYYRDHRTRPIGRACVNVTNPEVVHRRQKV